MQPATRRQAVDARVVLTETAAELKIDSVGMAVGFDMLPV